MDWICRLVGPLVAAIVVFPSTLTIPVPRDAKLAAELRDGDAAFKAFDNEAARLCYERAFAIDSTNCVVLWKLAQTHVNAGMVASKDDKAGWFTSALAHARRSVALCPDSAEAHFFLAVSIGQMTKVVGNKHRIELSKDVQHEAEVTLKLNPKHAGAMHILGRWNFEIASLSLFSRMAAKIVYGGVPPGASYEQAKVWFERAIEVRPEMPLNHLWLGETLIKMDDYPRAREELQKCLDLDDVLWDDSITKTQARKTLHDIEGKD